MDTSVDLTSATTSEPTTRPRSSTERVVMTEVTMPHGVSTSTSETTEPRMISRTLPLNWLRTLMAWMDMVKFSWVKKTDGWGRMGSDRKLPLRCRCQLLAALEWRLCQVSRGVACKLAQHAVLDG